MNRILQKLRGDDLRSIGKIAEVVKAIRLKKVLIILGHPFAKSFCNALAQKYIAGVKESGNEVEVLNLQGLSLEKFLKYEHRENPQLPPDLLQAQKLITWADHLVFAYPTWWATPPALLKVFFEIVFEPGFAFKYQETTGSFPKWDKLLTNKSARVIVTMDSPPWYYKLAGDAGGKMMKNSLGFCGIKPISKNYYGSVKLSSVAKRKEWLAEAYKIGLGE